MSWRDFTRKISASALLWVLCSACVHTHTHTQTYTHTHTQQSDTHRTHTCTCCTMCAFGLILCALRNTRRNSACHSWTTSTHKQTHTQNTYTWRSVCSAQIMLTTHNACRSCPCPAWMRHAHIHVMLCVLNSDSVYNTIYTKHYASGAALAIHGQHTQTHTHFTVCALLKSWYNSWSDTHTHIHTHFPLCALCSNSVYTI